MTRVSFGGRRVMPLLVALVVSLLLGHVCALPEWVVVEATDSHAPGTPDDADASHVASCDATLVKTAPACPPSVDAPSAVLPAVTIPRDVSGRAMATAALVPLRRAPERAVFLLHASFLI